jgi:hypothetical protein
MYISQLKTMRVESESVQKAIIQLNIAEQVAWRTVERCRKAINAHKVMLEDIEHQSVAVRRVIIAGGYECDLIPGPFSSYYREENIARYHSRRTALPDVAQPDSSKDGDV